MGSHDEQGASPSGSGAYDDGWHSDEAPEAGDVCRSAAEAAARLEAAKQGAGRKRAGEETAAERASRRQRCARPSRCAVAPHTVRRQRRQPPPVAFPSPGARDRPLLLPLCFAGPPAQPPSAGTAPAQRTRSSRRRPTRAPTAARSSMRRARRLRRAPRRTPRAARRCRRKRTKRRRRRRSLCRSGGGPRGGHPPPGARWSLHCDGVVVGRREGLGVPPVRASASCQQRHCLQHTAQGAIRLL